MDQKYMDSKKTKRTYSDVEIIIKSISHENRSMEPNKSYLEIIEDLYPNLKKLKNGEKF